MKNIQLFLLFTVLGSHHPLQAGGESPRKRQRTGKHVSWPDERGKPYLTPDQVEPQPKTRAALQRESERPSRPVYFTTDHRVAIQQANKAWGQSTQQPRDVTQRTLSPRRLPGPETREKKLRAATRVVEFVTPERPDERNVNVPASDSGARVQEFLALRGMINTSLEGEQLQAHRKQLRDKLELIYNLYESEFALFIDHAVRRVLQALQEGAQETGATVNEERLRDANVEERAKILNQIQMFEPLMLQQLVDDFLTTYEYGDILPPHL